MKNYAWAFLILFFVQNTNGQNSLHKIWDYRFGGTKNESIGKLISTKDKGYLIGGSSASGISGDRSQPNQDTINQTDDYWIVKLDSNGTKQWDKRYGGNRNETLSSLTPLPDGGYLLGGTSYSSASGDKSGILKGQYDIWMVRIDSAGSIIWEKNYGGDYYANLSKVILTSDNSYILAGWVVSGVSGDVTQPSKGAGDYWVLKVNADNGAKQWDKRYGGESGDILTSVEKTADAGYLLCGTSDSETGDFTAPLKGLNDFRFLKISSNGTKIWDKTIGSCLSDFGPRLISLHDGSLAVAGFTNAGICGDKTQYSWNTSQDTWLVKTNSSIVKIWDKDFGGSQFETVQDLIERDDHGFVVVSMSNSPISGDKTESNLGETQTWVVITDSTGNKIADKTIRTNGNDIRSFVVESGSGCFTLLVQTNGGIGGEKSQPNWDATQVSHDLWIVKYCDSAFATKTQSLISRSFADVFPNPAGDFIQLKNSGNEGKISTVRIKNSLGQILISIHDLTFQQGVSHPIDVQKLPSGVYFLEIESGGQTVLQKLLRQ